jgi:hypothetical protein
LCLGHDRERRSDHGSSAPLWHANPAITLLVYSHSLKHSESDVADRLADNLLSFPSASGTQKEIESAA